MAATGAECATQFDISAQILLDETGVGRNHCMRVFSKSFLAFLSVTAFAVALCGQKYVIASLAYYWALAY